MGSGSTLLPAGPAPRNIRVSVKGPTEVRISWDPAPGATGYSVKRSRDAKGPFGSVTPSAFAGANFSDKGVMPGSTVYYIVSASFSSQSEGQGTPVPATTPPGLPPTNLRAAKPNISTVTLQWDPAPGASGYLVLKDRTAITGGQNIVSCVTCTGYAETFEWNGTYTYQVASYFHVEGVGEVLGNLNNLPNVAVTVTPKQKEQRTFNVSGRSSVSSMGFKIQKGSVVSISAQGEIDFGGGVLGIGAPVLGPDGDDSETPGDYPAPNLRKNSLIFRVGAVWYQGGTHKVFTVDSQGDLDVGLNDKELGDNTGSLTVAVSVTPPYLTP